MKKIILMLAIGAFSFAAHAQENAIKVNPFAILGGNDLVSYERAFNDNSTGIISAAYTSFGFSGAKYQSVGAGLQYRYYFSEAIRGWYLGAGIGYQSGNVEGDGDTFSDIESESVDVDFSSFTGGIKGGYQWSWDSGFTLDLNLGANYVNFTYDDSEESTNFDGTGILPSFGLGLGYAF